MKFIRIWHVLVLAFVIISINCYVHSNRDDSETTGLISDLENSDTIHVTQVVKNEGDTGVRVKRSGKSSGFEESGGSKHGEDHYSKKGEKGDKGYKKKHHYDKGDKGHHDEKKAAGHHEEHGGHKKKKHEEDGGYKKHHEEGHKKKGGKKGHKKHHKKGEN